MILGHKMKKDHTLSPTSDTHPNFKEQVGNLQKLAQEKNKLSFQFSKDNFFLNLNDVIILIF